METTLSINGMNELSIEEQLGINGGFIFVAIVVVVVVVAVACFAAGVYSGYQSAKRSDSTVTNSVYGH